ncbi:hypothetical protein [Nostoc sp. NZL]|uniref:hypothetical protein n=1 Tax=Nostoc sp. NZL TaxID=2650612 RepID=UPI0018C7B891|nr:hypothetical protein [Nostoc sp. NZL]
MARLTGLFPPGKGGGEEIAYGGKGKGILIHTLTEGNGMPDLATIHIWINKILLVG